jgi:kynureninase
MGPQFRPMAGAEGWQLSNPSIMAMAPLRASLEIFAAAGMANLRNKSVSLTGYLEFLLNQNESDKFTVITPRDPERRGAQLSIRIRQNGRAVLNRLIAEGFVCDWREPDILRVAPAPLYNTFTDVRRFAEHFLAALG